MAVTVHHGDCLQVMRQMIADGALVQSVVTDPPYHLTSIVKRFGKVGSAEAKDRDGLYRRASAGFMGKMWDGGDIAFRPEVWELCFALLPPGGHLLAFGGTRTYHRMACAIEDAGFEIRDQIGWLYGSGFPKSHNQHGEWEGWGTALKPAWEPIVLARKPLDGTVAENLATHSVGALNIKDSRVHAEDAQGGEYTVKRLKPGATLEKTGGNWRPENGLDYRGQMQAGRWPANVIHDGSAEVVAAFPDAPGQQADVSLDAPSAKTGNVYGKMNRHGEKSRDARYHDKGSTDFAALPGMRRLDDGSAARFFYSAKADSEDRLGSKHPTVKPVDLMAYLCRLVTPPGGTVLDPFAGSGSTGMACMRESFNAVLIEREAEYVADIRARIAHVHGDDTPLFRAAE